MQGLQTIAQCTAEIAPPSMVLVILRASLTPLMLLSAALAIVALIRARSEKKRWIPIACGGGFIALILLQLFLLIRDLHSILDGDLYWYDLVCFKDLPHLLAIAFLGPVIAIPAIIGLAAGLFRKTSVRAIFGIATWLILVITILFATKQYDWFLSTYLLDARPHNEEKLWSAQRDTYATALKENNRPVDLEEFYFEDNDLPLPDDVLSDINRDSFFKEFPPPSVLKAALNNTLFPTNAEYSAYIEQVREGIYEKHLAACAAEGIRLAKEKVKREHKD